MMHNRIAVPKFSLTDSSISAPITTYNTSQREIAMDSQIQLHQDMLSQNRYYLNRSINNPTTHSIMSFGDMVRRSETDAVITSSEDDLERNKKEKERTQALPETSRYDLSSITDVLTAPTVGEGRRGDV